MRAFKLTVVTILFVIGTLFTGCKSASNTQKGAVYGATGGALLGAGIGALAGGSKGAAWGAAIGAAVGGGTGAIIGNKMDKQARAIDEALPSADVERVGEAIHITLKEDAIRFATNKSTLTPQAQANLDKLIPIFNEYNETNINIYGYTDNVGAKEYNLTLSQKRADEVKKYLISKGLAPTRFITKGMGMEQPIASNDTKEGQSMNRRVEFAITANEKMIQEAKKEAGN
ncbi:MAG TPA: OmpA family protein [Flavobacterium sp.]|uniref:OmpA family protein n=1 Tax=Flavobacterium sp. TaxID=239 RepID=UPI002D15C566|nr:OmpA family protein [Flavobacterium sp.]HSD15103.1 OmpA family protein [Flavobacterium sp.]